MNNNGLWSTNGDKITTGCIDNQDGKDFKCTKLEKPENIVGLQVSFQFQTLSPQFLRKIHSPVPYVENFEFSAKKSLRGAPYVDIKLSVF